MAIAECIENKGRFVPAIEKLIRALCAAKTWVHPCHDRQLANISGQRIEIDLDAARNAEILSAAYYCLGDKLSPEVRQLIRGELERRILVQFEEMVETSKTRITWLHSQNNWNAVCLSGVFSTALTMIKDRQRRAFFVASVEKYIQNFLSGFSEGGYCDEGLAYWNYGFGQFVRLAETVRRATDGQIDMFDDRHVAKIARFGRDLEILPGVFPSFADCHFAEKPAPWLMAFLNDRFQLGVKEFRSFYAEKNYSELTGIGLFNLGKFTHPQNIKHKFEPLPLRSWFSGGGVLICRPDVDQEGAIGVALKGGHNGEHHNHNDIGSFVVALGSKSLIVDPGLELYTLRTFSKRRYESDVINSFGHSVPKVAGKLQRRGSRAFAKVLEADFTDEHDELSMDISSAYSVKGLKKLHRTFVYSRRGKGQLRVIDEVEFEKPMDFETALITFSKWHRSGPSSLLIGEGDEVVRVDISTEGAPFEVESQTIKEDLPGRQIPVRIAIRLKEPSKKATITTTISAL